MDVDMDIDHPFPSTDLSLHHSAPVAGPSTLPTPPPPPGPTLFLLSPAPAAPLPLLRGSEDVLGRFRLHEAYDKFVRPFFGPDPTDRSTNHPPHPDKGKGKERDGGEGGGEVEEEEVEKDWRRQNTYKYLIKGLPGSHSTKKDQFLSDKVNAPPKQHIDVVPFEFPLEKNPFIVDGLGIPGWGGRFDEESKEERRRRKEAKKLAKAQALGITPINTSFLAPTPTPATGTPTAAATPQPHSAARARGGTPQAATPTSVTATAAAAPRGVKREHEDSAARPATPSGRPTHANGSMPPIANGALPARPAQPVTNGNAMYGTTPPMTNGTGAGGGRAGVEGARPRPKKKQRLDLQGQARDMLAVPAQQPTPQGV